jgi:hypothetical protein
MSFTDQKPRKATEEHLKARWGGGHPGEKFRCYLCGQKFQVGDVWRWVYGNNRKVIDPDGKTWGVCNFIVCEDCDGDDVLDRWVKRNEEAHRYFWWLM